MLVATRDPMHHHGAHDPSSSPRDHRDGVPGAHPAPHAARAVTMLQLAGSFLAIPAALGSAYSIYQANFSTDTQCQSLRAGIISMIDKKIDAATRRMLVRRDVETFEKSCGSFDPDAKAAFVTLLAAQPLKVPVHAAVPKAEVSKVEAPKVEAVKAEPAKAEAVKTELTKVEPAKAEPVKTEAAKVESPAKEAVRKVEPRPAAVAAKHDVPAPVVTEAVARDAATSDARWLDAVRGALLTHESARDAAETARKPAEAQVLKSSLTPSSLGAPAAMAPALPAATAISSAANPQPERSADVDHPVPPGAIPEAPPLDTASASGHPRSTWVSHIPFVGQVLDK